jgi:hypothetical protein
MILYSCNDDDNSNSAVPLYPYSVRMTDAPGPYDEVNIDLKGVEVIASNGQTVTFAAQAGMYNLLELTNGVNVLIANGLIGDARVNQVRLILGPNNTIVVDGVSHPLSTPSAEQSGLKLLVNQTLQANVENTILVDFDASQSIVDNGDGTYKLKPVLRTIVTTSAGKIKGKIAPIGTMAYVTATSLGGVTYSTYVNASGDYQILGVTAGTYAVTVTPSPPFIAVTYPAVVVVANATFDVGVTTFE